MQGLGTQGPRSISSSPYDSPDRPSGRSTSTGWASSGLRTWSALRESAIVVSSDVELGTLAAHAATSRQERPTRPKGAGLNNKSVVEDVLLMLPMLPDRVRASKQPRIDHRVRLWALTGTLAAETCAPTVMIKSGRPRCLFFTGRKP